jgi:hypothetical protein
MIFDAMHRNGGLSDGLCRLAGRDNAENFFPVPTPHWENAEIINKNKWL